jgi:hypothetical protein
MNRMIWVATGVLLVAGCSTTPAIQKPAVQITPPQDVAASPVVREPVATLPLPVPAPDAEKTPAPPLAPVVVPANTLYVCVVDAQGVRQQTAIEFTPKIGALCGKHPEMGPCQYERNVCRRSGGRVFAANGVEITQLIETDYDKRVLRVVFRGDDGPAPPPKKQKPRKRGAPSPA